MSDLPDRVRRAVRDDDAFRPAPEPGTVEATTTPFEATATAAAAEGGETRFEVTVAVPTLSAVVAGGVAPVVEDGWYETFELRVADPGGATRGDHDLDPTVRRAGETVTVTYDFAELDPRRGVADARALVHFVEGTYVQGVIPGYDYEEPVAGLVAEARRAAGGEPSA